MAKEKLNLKSLLLQYSEESLGLLQKFGELVIETNVLNDKKNNHTFLFVDQQYVNKCTPQLQC